MCKSAIIILLLLQENPELTQINDSHYWWDMQKCGEHNWLSLHLLQEQLHSVQTNQKQVVQQIGDFRFSEIRQWYEKYPSR